MSQLRHWKFSRTRLLRNRSTTLLCFWSGSDIPGNLPTEVHGFPLQESGSPLTRHTDAPGNSTPLEADFWGTFMDPLGRRSPTPLFLQASCFWTLTDGIGMCHFDRSAAATGAGPTPKRDNRDVWDPRRRMTGSTWSHAAAAIFTAMECLSTAFHPLPVRPASFRLCSGGRDDPGPRNFAELACFATQQPLP